jgi:hypothetical protein
MRRLALARNPARRVQPSSLGLVDYEYASRRWDYLGGLLELLRYTVIAGDSSTAGDGFTALNADHGTGVPLNWLVAAGGGDYLGFESWRRPVRAMEQARRGRLCAPTTKGRPA